MVQQELSPGKVLEGAAPVWPAPWWASGAVTPARAHAGPTPSPALLPRPVLGGSPHPGCSCGWPELPGQLPGEASLRAWPCWTRQRSAPS